MATALYRRYRPETFADVIGQEHVTEPLMQALRTGRVNHAYLFSGPRGCGKTTSARILARCLNCEQGPTPTPCGTCDSCVALARGGSGSVDVIEIDAASHGGVDDARELRERASYGPAQSRFKIYIIDEAHMVTPQGFNALLKIVEEPPEHVKFVFATTEPEKVIGTIRSRTHHYPFRLVPPAKLSAYMERLLEQEGVPAAPGVLSFVTRAGGGSVRDSLSVLDQLIAGSGPEGLTYDDAVSLLGFTDGELLDATVDALAAGDGAATFRQIDKVIESGHDPRRFIEDLLERLRDLIIVAAVQEGAAQVLRGVPEDQLERMRVQQAAFGPGALSRAADIVNTGLTEMTGATAPRMQLELICARILLPASSGEQGYAARLDRLERRLEVGGVPSASGDATGPAGMPLSSPPGPPPLPSAAPSGPMAGVGAAVAVAGPDPGPAARADAARARAGAPPVVAPAESVGGPSASKAGHGSSAATPSSVGADRSARPTEAVGGSMGTGAGDASGPAGAGQAGASPASIPPTGTRPAGGMDTDAIRRAWPNVLGRIFTMRRITWTFVSQNAQVTAFDGQTLTLGIATAGLTQTFRAGNHAEVVRQALIDELGVDAVVNGVHVDDVSQQAPVAPPQGAVPPAGDADLHRGSDDDRGDGASGSGSGGAGSGSHGSAGSGPHGSAGSGPHGSAGSGPRGGAGSGSGGSGPAGGGPGTSRQSWGDAGAGHDAGAARGSAGGAFADAGLTAAASRSHYDNAGWGSASGPAPDWAAGPVPGEDAADSGAAELHASETASAATGPRSASVQPPARPSSNRPGDAAGSQPGDAAGSQPGNAAGGQPGGAAGNQPGNAAGGQPGGAAGIQPGDAAGSQTSNRTGSSGSQTGGRTGGQGGTATGNPTAAAKRGARAVRESIAQARTGAATIQSGDDSRSAAELTDDSAVSADDEDIEVSGDVGRTVIERVLGGRVIRELDE